MWKRSRSSLIIDIPGWATLVAVIFALLIAVAGIYVALFHAKFPDEITGRIYVISYAHGHVYVGFWARIFYRFVASGAVVFYFSITAYGVVNAAVKKWRENHPP